MIKKTIFYKGKEYEVTNPGELIYSKVQLVNKTRKIYQIVDQLNNLSEIKGNKRVSYLKSTYGLTELDYYIIVVLEGDESKLPICNYVNPKTKEICNKPKKFYTLVPNIPGRDIFCIGCEDHVINASAQVKQRLAYKKNITGLQKADRRSKTWRDKLRKHALKQMAEGRSIFSPDEVRKEYIKKPISTVKVSGYNELFSELGINRDNCSIDELILVDKEMFLRKGNLEDTCYYYIATLEGKDMIFKLGVTSNIESRSKRGYQGIKYESLEILYTSTRVNIAEIEYKVKLKFKNYIIFGNEGFDNSVKNEIISYIKEIIS